MAYSFVKFKGSRCFTSGSEYKRTYQSDYEIEDKGDNACRQNLYLQSTIFRVWIFCIRPEEVFLWLKMCSLPFDIVKIAIEVLLLENVTPKPRQRW